MTVAPVIDQPGWQLLTIHDIGGAEAMRETQSSGEDSMLRAPEVLAHEIKNPLAGIRGAAQLLGRKLDGNDLAMTRLIADEVDRIAKLIDQMQSLSRRTSPELTPCNLHEAVRRARAVIEAGGRSPQIAEEFDPSLPAVLGNGDALVQVGFAYAMAGDFDNGIKLIDQGIAKGSLRRPDDAKLRLGMALLQSGKAKTRATQVPAFKRSDQGFLVDQITACGIDHEGFGLEQGQAPRIEQVVRFRARRAMQ